MKGELYARRWPFRVSRVAFHFPRESFPDLSEGEIDKLERPNFHFERVDPAWKQISIFNLSRQAPGRVILPVDAKFCLWFNPTDEGLPRHEIVKRNQCTIWFYPKYLGYQAIPEYYILVIIPFANLSLETPRIDQPIHTSCVWR